MSDSRDAQIVAGARAMERYNLGLHEPERRIIAAAVRDAVAPLIATQEAKRIALKWQWGGWTILTAPVKGAGSINVLGLGQLVTDWLHAEVSHD